MHIYIYIYIYIYICSGYEKNSSLRLINKSCYKGNGHTITTECGEENEGFSREEYHKISRTYNQGIAVERSRLLINFDYSHIAVSSNAIFTCFCCSEECVQIKCLPKYKDRDIEFIAHGKSYLQKMMMVNFAGY